VKRKKEKHFVHPISPSQSSQRLHPEVLVEIIAVLILAGIPFAMGKFFEFNQPDPFDGGGYAYSAWHVYQGASFGKDEIISAQPATFLVNYIGVALCGFSELGAKLIQMALQLAALGMMFYALRKCFGKSAAILCTAMASIYLSAPVIAKFGNVKEQFMIAFMVMAACFLILAIKTKKEWLWAVTGAFAVWPYYFKPTGLSILAATGLCVVFFSLQKRNWKLLLNRLLFLSIGAIAGISPLLLFFFLKTGRPIFFQSLPLLLIQAMIASAVIGYAIVGVAGKNRLSGFISRVKTVRPVYWTTGASAIVLVYIIGSIIVRIQPGAIGQDIVDYIAATPFFAVPQHIYYQISGFVHLLWRTLGASDIYITGSRNLMGFSQQAPIVFRYYAVLKLPILMASISILIGLVRLFFRLIKKIPAFESQDWMALFLAIWWIFDMGMIWVSPRSYEQYYLPMCASAAMLSGYGIGRFMERWNPVGSFAGRILAPAALVIMIGMVWPIFSGITHSPFSGQAYGQKSRGYAQTWASTWEKLRKKELGPWEQLGDYIRSHSGPEDRMYVWGWYPGIYVRAQRLSASPQASEGNMHIVPPYSLAGIIYNLTTAFTQHPPKFIVDSRKREFPWNVPPLELWPQRPYVPNELQDNRNGFLSRDPLKVRQFEMIHSAGLAQKASPEEAERFMAMKPFRDYVMSNYKIVGSFGPHVLFVRTTPAGTP
jgi:hypothetical protein